ncbi:ZrgA family zinc uptake protein [Agaribacter marinus]|uniref:DUF2796 domain-containing protein n=1 Tax=Agaribacter marinus TaxID=1431249 RepID=A0AA37WIZ1_9ALTE|nr:DUF2796 domain-containing protein [Agaribacter marinus]GLR71583.1 hypothetical protein GCM10007852_24910 [Agaribacter marinus]
MKLLKQLAVFSCLLSSYSLAQTHMHGKGTLFIAQDGNTWQLQFTLPASDVFGFEHQPETKKQQEYVHMQSKRLKQLDKVLSLPNDCALITHEVVIPNEFDIKHFDKHSNDDKPSHEHEHEHEHEKHTSDHADTHADIQVTTTLDCNTAISVLNFAIFESFNSLETVDVLWTLSSGQGQSEISASNPKVKL